MSDASSLGNAFEGNVTPQIDPPQVGVGPDTDKVGAGVLAPKHPHWRNDPKTKERMDDRSSIKKNKVNEGPKNENYTAVKLRDISTV
ncbi:MAG TPA: hypothetical protein VH558_06785 [Pseudolabrys sp.]